MKEILKNSAIVLVSLAVVAVILEVGIRAYSHFFFPRMMEIDAELGWRHAFNREKIFVNELGEAVLVRHDSHGLRGPERDLANDPNLTRVLVLGDSFTEAVHVTEEQTYAGRLAAAHAGWQVLNAGVGGYGTVQQYRYLDLYGESLRPDIVLLAVYENDLADNCLSYYPSFGPRPFARLSEGQIVIVEEPDAGDFGRFALRVPFWRALNAHSYLYNFVNTRVYQTLRAARMRELSSLDLAATQSCGRMEILQGVLALADRRAKNLGAAFAVVYIPSMGEARTGSSATSDMMLAGCETHHMQCLSLLGPLHAAIEAGMQPYFERDIHWTSTGHRVAADAIEPFIARLVPSSRVTQ